MATEETKNRARELRMAGLSVAQITEQMGLRSQSMVWRWVADLPIPEWTRRPRAKDELRARARSMRLQGASYGEIKKELGVSKGSVSLWVRDLPVPPDLRKRVSHAHRIGSERWLRERERRESERRAVKASAEALVGRISDRELLLLGAVLYWAEGAKDKPYSRRECVKFINSDPDVINVFLRWLDLVRAPEENRRFRISIHESADLGDAHRYWSQIAGVPIERFDRPTLKRHRPTTRKNVGTGYHGCLMISVVKSRILYQQIEGLWLGVTSGADHERDHRWQDAATV